MEDGEFLRNYYNFQNGVTYLVLVQKNYMFQQTPEAVNLMMNQTVV